MGFFHMNINSQVSLLSTSYWQQIDFFKNLAPDVIKDILIDAEVIETSPKKILFYEGEPTEGFGFVIDGVFKLYRTDSMGRRAITDFISTGELIAAMLMENENSVYPITVQAVSFGRFLKIPKSTYTHFWSPRPEIIKKIQCASMVRIQSLLNMRDTQRLGLEQRVAFVLVKQLAKYAVKNNFLKVYFSRSDIADAIGSAPESVIRVFSQWSKDGLIEINNGDEFINLELINKKFLQTN